MSFETESDLYSETEFRQFLADDSNNSNSDEKSDSVSDSEEEFLNKFSFVDPKEGDKEYIDPSRIKIDGLIFTKYLEQCSNIYSGLLDDSIEIAVKCEPYESYERNISIIPITREYQINRNAGSKSERIVKVLGHSTYEGLFCIIMEKCGVNLDQILEKMRNPSMMLHVINQAKEIKKRRKERIEGEEANEKSSESILEAAAESASVALAVSDSFSFQDSEIEKIDELERNYFARKLDWTFDLVDSLTDLHSIGIVHGDVRPMNFVLDNNRRMKLCDFGLANYGKHEVYEIMEFDQTAPELIDRRGRVSGRVNYSTDVYSVAWIISEEFFNDPCRFTPPEFLSLANEIRSIIEPCIKQKRKSRPAARVLQDLLSPLKSKWENQRQKIFMKKRSKTNSTKEIKIKTKPTEESLTKAAIASADESVKQKISTDKKAKSALNSRVTRKRSAAMMQKS